MFDSGATKNETFYNYNKSESIVPMMSRNTYYNYIHDDRLKASVIELPYLGDISMYILLPDERYDLNRIIQKATHNQLKELIESMSSADIELQFPKFEYSASIDLLQTLPKLGVDIRQVLRPLDKQLIVSSASHEAKIKVHESGTEAAAVTIYQFIRIRPGLPTIKIPIKVDHPFAYIIRDNKSKINLFAGVVNKIN
ncbi:serine protease inhibitor 4-like protein [Leptotrombidium deliense]|uniref:Serine protease inhibitor 4-like protein n=1 Tax=Leptotrombidium deliense TaxID=299467 RepID=A0A443S6A6_9ACAR|nr:serine protease inhibitor 4-like protein [Leptotrombidium deliense]